MALAGRRQRVALAGALVLLGGVLLLLLPPKQSDAASGCPIQNEYGYGVVRVFDSEPATGCQYYIQVVCNGLNHVAINYAQLGDTPSASETGDITKVGNPPVECQLVQKVRVDGAENRDVIDLSPVTAGTGFTGISSSNVVHGGDGPDTIFGSPFADRLIQGADGSAGKLKGLGGSDKLIGDDGRDKLVGGDGSDLMRGHDGSDTCRGGSGHDRATSCESTSSVP
jgi:hypothetical protein